MRWGAIPPTGSPTRKMCCDALEWHNRKKMNK
nr:MAG TPA_asm: hypothetical protein [Caudoviricetes sp.]DAM18226.1 MAG TPA: hypothetical protein [Caudoviricetes sp.]DAS89459.1 MAG TPA: hypothetical protein [Caudoviricetes sp.]